MYRKSEELRAWLHRLEGLAMAIANAPTGREGDLVRLFHDLMASAPDPALLGGLHVPDVERLDALLAADAADSAALAFMGEHTGFCLSGNGDGGHLASVLLLGAPEEVTASGPTLALACLAALALAVADAPLTVRARAATQETSSTLLH